MLLWRNITFTSSQVPRRTLPMKLVWHSLNLCLLFTPVFVAAFKWIFHDSSVTQLSAEQTSASNNTFNQLCLDNTLWSKFYFASIPYPPFVVHVQSFWQPTYLERQGNRNPRRLVIFVHVPWPQFDKQLFHRLVPAFKKQQKIKLLDMHWLNRRQKMKYFAVLMSWPMADA